MENVEVFHGENVSREILLVGNFEVAHDLCGINQ